MRRRNARAVDAAVAAVAAGHARAKPKNAQQTHGLRRPERMGRLLA